MMEVKSAHLFPRKSELIEGLAGWVTCQNWENMQISVPTQFSLLPVLLQEKTEANQISTFQNEIARRRRERTSRRQSQRRNRQRYWKASLLLQIRSSRHKHLNHPETPAINWKHLKSPGTTWNDSRWFQWNHLDSPGCFQRQRQHLQPTRTLLTVTGPISNGSSERNKNKWSFPWIVWISQQFNNFIRMIFEFAQKWQDFYGGAYMRISVKLRGRTEHIKESASSSSEWQIQNLGNNSLELHLARTYNDYSRASSRNLRLLELNLLEMMKRASNDQLEQLWPLTITNSRLTQTNVSTSLLVGLNMAKKGQF